MSLCHKLGFLNPNFFKTKCCRPQIFQTMNSGGSSNISLTYKNVCIIWLLRFRYYKIVICGKNSIPLIPLANFENVYVIRNLNRLV